MKNLTLILPAMLLGAISTAWAQPDVNTQVAAVEEQTAQYAAQEAQEAARAQQLNLDMVQAQWERCDIYEYYQRRNSGWSKAGRKKVVTNCTDVDTRCQAVSKEGNVFVPTTCFYADKTKKQRLKLKTIRLLGMDKAIALQMVQKAKDFVVLRRN